MSKLATPHSEFDSAEPVLVDADAFPRRNLPGDDLIRLGRFHPLRRAVLLVSSRHELGT